MESNHRNLSISNLRDFYVNEPDKIRNYKTNKLEYSSDINKLFERFFYIYNAQKKIFDIILNRDNYKTIEVNLICVKCFNERLEICECNNIDIIQISFSKPFSTKFNILFNETQFEFSENFETATLSIDILDIINNEEDNLLLINFRKLLRLVFEFIEINPIGDGKVKINKTDYLNSKINTDNEYNFNYIDKYFIN